MINVFIPQLAIAAPHAKHLRLRPEDGKRNCPRALWVSFVVEEMS